MTYEIKLLAQKTDMLPLFPLFQQLNPKVSAERYDYSLDDMVARGYRMVAVFAGSECVGMSGIWTATKFYSGKYFELDNVVVDAKHRSAGIGQLMCDYIETLAQAEAVETLMLDAYRENFKGHIFYERAGFFPRGYHFVKPLTAWSKTAISPLPERFVALDRAVRSEP